MKKMTKVTLMDFDEDDVIIKTKGKIIAITTIAVISIIIFLIISTILIIKSSINDLSKHKYYVLQINEQNNETIKHLIIQAQKNYCDSMYKIEYSKNAMNNINFEIYCKKENNITFSINNDDNELLQYILEYGTIEKR